MKTFSDDLEWIKARVQGAKAVGYTHIPVPTETLSALIEMFEAIEEHIERIDNAVTEAETPGV